MSVVRCSGGVEINLQVVDRPTASVLVLTVFREGKPIAVELTSNEAQSLEMHIAAERFEAELRNRGG